MGYLHTRGCNKVGSKGQKVYVKGSFNKYRVTEWR